MSATRRTVSPNIIITFCGENRPSANETNTGDACENHPICHLPIRADRYNLRVKIQSRLLTKLIAFLVVGLTRLIFKSCRVQIFLEEPGTCPYEPTGSRRYLYCVWHDQIMMTVFCGRPKAMAGLVSGHRDGSYLAEAMKLVGIAAIRGSSKRGGSRAMGELLYRVRNFHVAITPDGPRGPRRKIKTGIVFLASHSGRVIIPAAHVCRHAWHISGSWTDMMLPRPFTQIYACGGRPFVVPAGLDRHELQQYAERLEAEMERLEALLSEWCATSRLPAAWVNLSQSSRPADPANSTRAAA